MTSALSRCRLCGREEGKTKFRNIFEGEQGMSLHLKINKLLPIVVIQWDPLPHGVCEVCVEKLNLMDRFYDDTNNTDKFLRSLLPFIPKYQIETLEPVIKIRDFAQYYGHHIKLVEEKMEEEAEVVEVVEVSAQAAKPPAKPARPEKTLECFLVNPITSTDSVFTCRECYRTYTTSASALSHLCVDSQEIDGEPESPEKNKTLPPLKIRLVSSGADCHFCDICKATFGKKTELIAHRKKHYAGPEISANKRNRRRVKSRDSSGSESSGEQEKFVGKFNCRTCGEILPSKLELQCHVKIHGVNRVGCSDGQLENMEDDDDDDLEILDMVETKKYTCVFCSKSYKRHQDLVTHQRQHLQSNPKEFLSDDLKIRKKPSRRSKPRYHWKPSTNELRDRSDNQRTDLHVCRTCNMTFTRKSPFIAHEQLHCMEEFNYKFSDDEEEKEEDEDEDDDESDDSGVFRAKRRRNSNSQLSTPRSDVHVYSCDKCNASFSRKSTFIAHERLHSTELNHQLSDEEGESDRHNEDEVEENEGEADGGKAVEAPKQTKRRNFEGLEDLDPPEVQIHTCNTCNMSFTRKSTFIAHEQLHCMAEFNYKLSDEEEEEGDGEEDKTCDLNDDSGEQNKTNRKKLPLLGLKCL